MAQSAVAVVRSRIYLAVYKIGDTYYSTRSSSRKALASTVSDTDIVFLCSAEIDAQTAPILEAVAVKECQRRNICRVVNLDFSNPFALIDFRNADGSSFGEIVSG